MKGITKMLNQKVLLPILILILAISSIIGVVATSPREAHPRGPEEGFQPLRYDLDSQQTVVKASLEQAIRDVQDVWPIPNSDFSSKLKRDDYEDLTWWKLTWKINNSPVVSASVDANTGKILSITDHRRKGSVDNLKGDDKAIKIAEEVLTKFGISTDGLSTPIVTISDMPDATSLETTYQVLWLQTFHGIRCDGASLRIRIDAETLKPVGYSNQLIDVPDIDFVTDISNDTALEVVEEFVESDAIKLKGYEKCEVFGSDLIIARPNYNVQQDAPLVPMGNASLAWCVSLRDSHGWRLDVMVDAHTGSIIGLNQYR
jgi:uncharacterized membrane protein YkoI